MTAYWSDPGFQTKNSSEWVNDKHINLLSKSAYVRRCVTEWNGAFSTFVKIRTNPRFKSGRHLFFSVVFDA